MVAHIAACWSWRRRRRPMLVGLLLVAAAEAWHVDSGLRPLFVRMPVSCRPSMCATRREVANAEPPTARMRGEQPTRLNAGATTLFMSSITGKAAKAFTEKAAKQWVVEGQRSVLSALKRFIALLPMLGTVVGVLDRGWSMLPLALRALISPLDLLLFVTTRLLYRRACRAVHAFHSFLYKRFGLFSEPYPYEESVLGFVEPKLGTLTNVIGITYIINVVVALLVDVGWRIPADSGRLLANLVYILFAAYFTNEVKKAYLPTWVPSLQEDKRRSYIFDRSSSVVLWVLAVLSGIECVSAYLKIPLSSTLAFGGIGGLAFGLASKDVIGNFFGGLMLLFTEPFTPGDMIHFTTRGREYEGKVERVGWYQTRLRGRDTRPTYVPNSVFVDTMVTNMDRITHRRFEANFALRYVDVELLPEVILEIKKALRVLPKVDLLSPLRVHFVKFAEYSVGLQASCYFATKSFDEYLYLQQCALMEIARVVSEKGCMFAVPTTRLDFQARDLGEALVSGVVDFQNNMRTVEDVSPQTQQAPQPQQPRPQAQPASPSETAATTSVGAGGVGTEEEDEGHAQPIGPSPMPPAGGEGGAAAAAASEADRAVSAQQSPSRKAGVHVMRGMSFMDKDEQVFTGTVPIPSVVAVGV